MNRRSFLGMLGGVPLAADACRKDGAAGKAGARHLLVRHCVPGPAAPGGDASRLFRDEVRRIRFAHDGKALFLRAIAAPRLPMFTSILFGATDDCPAPHAANQLWLVAPRSGMDFARSACFGADAIVEWKVFALPGNPGLRREFVQNAAVLFEQNEIRPFFSAVTLEGEGPMHWVCLTPFESLGARQRAWTRLACSREWQELVGEVFKEEAGGGGVVEVVVYRAVGDRDWDS